MTKLIPLLGVVLGVAVGCGDEGTTAPPTDVDTVLVLSPTGVSLAVGGNQTLVAVLVVSDTDTVSVQPGWTSRNGSVASVNVAGLVTGVSPGNTHVLAEILGLRDSVAVTVTGTSVQPPGLRRIASGLSQPVFAVAPPGDGTRLFVVEKTGAIRVLRNDTLLATPAIDISSLVSKGSEQGLLSMAFHPDFATNGFVYVAYTDTLGTSKVTRYQASAAETIDPATAFEILSVLQPYTNHNGGLVLFGSDGMLYVGLGDGGSGGDPDGNGQNRASLLGTILRLDVDGGTPYAIPADNPFVGQAGVREEIWVYGVRNPWRFSFDRSTGDLYIGDVGQGAREEIDVQPAASTGGENYGWNIMEGSICYGAATCSTVGLTLPVAEYPHSTGCSVTGGYVYRGTDVPALQGRYLYADYCEGWVRSFTYFGGQAIEAAEWPDLSPGTLVTSFAEDARGELYIMTIGGALYRIVPN
ncbi:MAG: PQQ-dependent sugar dehydrogenase [Gemmatimonadota bacterium]|nr:PQQ-dependent sugar dehydrogenase [Gemmatimonadota bacterium]MDH4352147.1 PQQ-dependent sugar dehydrogenase [Gemmatimonadota bacterium]MDH5198798.1 PQQ-dependent sugar dehydrogenase [Gemmatimonadota bacterium]